MRRFKFLFPIFLVILSVLSGVVSATTGSLSTNVTTDGGCEGVFFDVTALKEDIYITGFEIVLVGTAEIHVYYKEGTYSGFETNAGAWSLLGVQNMTGGSGIIQDLFPLNVGGVTIPAGQTYGFLIWLPDRVTTLVRAIRIDANANLSIHNEDIQIDAGSISCGNVSGVFDPFDAFMTNNVFRGTVLYITIPYFEQFEDGRINRFDNAAPFGAYPLRDSAGNLGLIFYDAYASSPTVLLTVTGAQIADVPALPDVNMLIAESADGRVKLYRLTNGQLQAQGPTSNGKQYVLIFPVISSSTPYESFEE